MGLNKNARGEELTSALKALEAALLPFQMRPHWGKMTSYSREDYERCYGSKLDDFRRVADTLDPAGKFRNDWAKAKIFGEIEEGQYSPYWLEDASTVTVSETPYVTVDAASTSSEQE
jgi:hypothetical protein